MHRFTVPIHFPSDCIRHFGPFSGLLAVCWTPFLYIFFGSPVTIELRHSVYVVIRAVTFI